MEQDLSRFKGLTFRSGQFAGRSMLEVAHFRAGYIVWCYENQPDHFGIPERVYTYARGRQKPKPRPVEPLVFGTVFNDPTAQAVQDFSPQTEEAAPEEPSFLDTPNAVMQEGSFLDGLFD